ncbi:MAG: 3'(2'),5'-bisphosphate nucleotidase CysQ [Steroidobacteraceae bacterium]
MSGGPAELLPRIAAIARRAAGEILEIYASGECAAGVKDDASPLTAADLRAHQIILESLRALTPQLPVLSEESALSSFAERSGWGRYWLVDPLDGTREFLARNGQFTVNIALIDRHTPVLGVVHVPVTDIGYQGLPGGGAWRQEGGGVRHAIRVAARSAAPIRVVGSRSHAGASLATFLARLGPYELVAVGSAIKFCMLAEGAADVYPRLGPTCEWDTAAAHAVLSAAGGVVRGLDGAPLEYNRRAGIVNPFFVAYGPQDHDWLELLQGAA